MTAKTPVFDANMKPGPHILLTVLTVLLTQVGALSRYRISGTVRTLNDTSMGLAIAGAKIDIDSSSYIAFTDSAGQYVLESIPAGTHMVMFMKQRYKTFPEPIDLQNDTTINISMPPDTADMPIGRIPFVPRFLKAFSQNINGHPRTWRTYPALTFLSGATAYDTTRFNEAFVDSGSGEEWKIGIKMFEMSTDSEYIKINHKGKIFLCNTSNYTQALNDYEYPEYLGLALCHLQSSAPVSFMHHENGWGDGNHYVDSSIYISTMNYGAAIPPMTNIDLVNQRMKIINQMARNRGEQDGHLMWIEDYVSQTTLNAPSIHTANSHLALSQQSTITWTPSFGSDYYHFQLANDSLFATLVVDDSTLQRISKQVFLDIGKAYYTRVRARNSTGISGWSATVMLRTANPRIAVGVSALELPIVAVHDTSRETFSISNPSIVSLTIDTLVLSQHEFTVIPTKLTIPPEDSTQITLLFMPDTIGVFADTLSIWNNSLESPFKVPVSGVGSPATGVSSRNGLPKSYWLSQNYPNPFNPTTTVNYGIPRRSHVKLEIVNTIGQIVARLVNTEQEAGYYGVSWNPDASSGLYFYRIETVSTADPSKSFTQVKKMLLIR